MPPRWLKQPAAMAVPITTPQVLERLGCFKNELRPFTVVSVPFPKKEVGQLWTGFFIMPYVEKLDNLHGRPMVNVVSGGTFYIHDKNSPLLSSNSTDPGAPGEMSGLKRVTIVVIKGIGIIAALAFCFSPVTTYPGILWFAAAIVVGGLCVVALSALDDDSISKHGHEGYWPKPSDWNSSPNDSAPTRNRQTAASIDR